MTGPIIGNYGARFDPAPPKYAYPGAYAEPCDCSECARAMPPPESKDLTAPPPLTPHAASILGFLGDAWCYPAELLSALPCSCIKSGEVETCPAAVEGLSSTCTRAC